MFPLGDWPADSKNLFTSDSQKSWVIKKNRVSHHQCRGIWKKKKKEKEITRSRSPVAQTAIFTQAKSNITKCEDIAARKISFSNLDKQKYIFIFKDLNSLCAIGGRLDYAACSHVSERCWLTATGEVVAGIEKKKRFYANDGLSKLNLGNLFGNYYCQRFRCSDMGVGGVRRKDCTSLFSFFFIWPTLSHIHLL